MSLDPDRREQCHRRTRSGDALRRIPANSSCRHHGLVEGQVLARRAGEGNRRGRAQAANASRTESVWPSFNWSGVIERTSDGTSIQDRSRSAVASIPTERACSATVRADRSTPSRPARSQRRPSPRRHQGRGPASRHGRAPRPRRPGRAGRRPRRQRRPSRRRPARSAPPAPASLRRPQPASRGRLGRGAANVGGASARSNVGTDGPRRSALSSAGMHDRLHLRRPLAQHDKLRLIVPEHRDRKRKPIPTGMAASKIAMAGTSRSTPRQDRCAAVLRPASPSRARMAIVPIAPRAPCKLRFVTGSRLEAPSVVFCRPLPLACHADRSKARG